MLKFTGQTCRNLEDATTREWLETNGLGGFASSTIVGLNTRRYHGLLFASTKPPVGRLLLLSKLEETLVVDNRRYELSANEYGAGVIHPRGFDFQTEFRLDRFPVFTHELEGLRLEKSIFMPHGENSVVIQYKLLRAAEALQAHESQEAQDSRQADASRQAEDVDALTTSDSSLITHHSSLILEVRPLVAFRDYHATTHENGALDPRVETSEGRASVAPYADLPTLHFAHDAREIETQGFWYRNFEYRRERERGLDSREDLFNPFLLKFDLQQGGRANIIASTAAHDAARADEFRRSETERRTTIAVASPVENDFARTLTVAAEQFVVAREAGHTVIAGYPWFGDWGRDTMIALHGLTLSTGRFDIARSILLEFSRHVSEGMLPNRFPDAGETPEYNTVDATLWYFEAARAYLQYSDDAEFVRDILYDVLADIVEWHVRGTRYGIRVAEDGLLWAGEEGAQLTWMDAKVGAWVVTPRHGKAVEIQALWYNALSLMQHLARDFGDAAGQTRYASMAARARESFNALFWNEEAGCLYDVVGMGEPDASIRPNQIFAVSLPYTMLSEERARAVVEKVERELLTPYGLRSLSPRDAAYRGRYEGDVLGRDGAYHQGTVWAWLLGAFITAYLKVAHGDAAAHAKAAGWLANFEAHMCEAGLGQVSEIFDGDAPYHARGCIAQAWSVAELLRAASEVAQSAEASGVEIVEAEEKAGSAFPD